VAGAHVAGAHVTGAHVTGAHVLGRQVRGAHVTGAHVSGAHVTGAHVKGAHVRGAQVLGRHVKQASAVSAMPSTTNTTAVPNARIRFIQSPPTNVISGLRDLRATPQSFTRLPKYSTLEDNVKWLRKGWNLPPFLEGPFSAPWLPHAALQMAGRRA
jgi:hypothetical protein